MSIGSIRAMAVTLAILVVSGCGDPPPRALFTVNYYKTHENDRLAKVKECQGNPAEAKTPDCVNAAQAQAQEEAEDGPETADDSSPQPAEGTAQPASQSSPQPAQPSKN
jgi:hypothetical protein